MSEVRLLPFFDPKVPERLVAVPHYSPPSAIGFRSCIPTLTHSMFGTCSF